LTLLTFLDRRIVHNFEQLLRRWIRVRLNYLAEKGIDMRRRLRSSRNFLAHSYLVLSAFLVSADRAFASVLDQAYAPSSCCTYYEFGTSQSEYYWEGQTFTAGLTGQLSQIDLAIYKNPSFDTGLSVDIFAYNPGVSTLGPLLGSISLGNSQIANFAGPGNPSNIYGLSLDVSGLNIGVDSGSSYAILAAVNNPINYQPGSDAISWIGSSFMGSDEYAAGHFTQAFGALADGTSISGGFGGADLGFKTYVTAVPAPPTSWLFLSGWLLLMACRRCVGARCAGEAFSNPGLVATTAPITSVCSTGSLPPY
jgi:hypothetical protein